MYCQCTSADISVGICTYVQSSQECIYYFADPWSSFILHPSHFTFLCKGSCSACRVRSSLKTESIWRQTSCKSKIDNCGKNVLIRFLFALRVQNLYHEIITSLLFKTKCIVFMLFKYLKKKKKLPVLLLFRLDLKRTKPLKLFIFILFWLSSQSKCDITALCDLKKGCS